MTLLKKQRQALIGNLLIALSLIGLNSTTVMANDFPPAGDASNGSKLWAENCARCHNMRSPDDLTDEQWITSTFHMRVRAGLTGQETRDILTFLQGANRPVGAVQAIPVSTNEQVSKVQRSGEAVYQSSCLACHSANGRGALPGVPDFTQADGRLAKTDAELLTNMINGFQSQGSPMAMPARGGNSTLTDAELSAALVFIRTSFGR